MSIDFAGGDDASVPHPELARVDGDAMILPWETTPIRVTLRYRYQVTPRGP